MTSKEGENKDDLFNDVAFYFILVHYFILSIL